MNAVATVQAVHRQTLRGAGSLDAYAKGFQQRLTALASANALVMDSDSRDAVTVHKLLEVEFAPYAADEGAGGERRLMLKWVESGGPKVMAPTRTGFGTRLLERSLQPPAGSVAV